MFLQSLLFIACAATAFAQEMTLPDFERMALAQNPTVRQAESLAKQSAGFSRQASLLPNPTVGYEGEQLRGGEYGGGENGGFIQQDIALAGKRKLRQDVYEQERREYEIGVTEQRYRVLGDVRQMFYSALAAQELAHLRKQILSVAQDTLATARQLSNVGQADAPDVLQAEVEAQEAETEADAAERAYAREFRKLAAMAGRPDLPVGPLSGDFQKPPELDTAKLEWQLIEESPQIKLAQQDVLRAEIAVKCARREAVPDLQLRAGLQQNSERLAEANPRPVGLQGFATMGVALPVFNRNQGNISAAAAELEHAEEEVNRTRLSLRTDANALLDSYRTAQDKVQKYRDAILPRAQQAYEMYLSKYKDMAASYPQVLFSQRSLFEYKLRYASALRDLWLAAVALETYGLSSGLSAPERRAQ